MSKTEVLLGGEESLERTRQTPHWKLKSTIRAAVYRKIENKIQATQRKAEDVDHRLKSNIKSH